MTNFDIETFATECKRAMADADDPMNAAADLLRRTIAEDPAAVIEVLEAAIPADATIGEMIVHRSPELTMLYARIPARFQSGIHDHTMFACIGQLRGEEHNVVFEKNDEGALEVARERTVNVGDVLTLPPDAIHSIENPGKEAASSLHLYGGDLAGKAEERALYTTADKQAVAFSFEALVAESIKRMKQDSNDDGLSALAEAIPATKPLIDG